MVQAARVYGVNGPRAKRSKEGEPFDQPREPYPCDRLTWTRLLRLRPGDAIPDVDRFRDARAKPDLIKPLLEHFDQETRGAGSLDFCGELAGASIAGPKQCNAGIEDRHDLRARPAREIRSCDVRFSHMGVQP